MILLSKSFKTSRKDNSIKTKDIRHKQPTNLNDSLLDSFIASCLCQLL